MKRALLLILLLLLVVSGWAMAAYEHGFAHFIGVDTQGSQNYDFVSGVGPMIITAIGLSTLITGLWHTLNCHEAGCWLPGRHKVNGTPWCNRHVGQARTELSLEDRLDKLISLMEARERRLASAVSGRRLRQPE